MRKVSTAASEPWRDRSRNAAVVAGTAPGIVGAALRAEGIRMCLVERSERVAARGR